MTEAYTSLQNTTRFYNSGSNVPFNFRFITAVNNRSSVNDFISTISGWIENSPSDATSNWVVKYLLIYELESDRHVKFYFVIIQMGNHDNARVETRYPQRGDQMIMLEMILPGVAVTYYGEEIGMVDKSDISYADTKDPQACNAGPGRYQSQSRDPDRTPFQWDNSTNAGIRI